MHCCGLFLINGFLFTAKIISLTDSSSDEDTDMAEFRADVMEIDEKPSLLRTRHVFVRLIVL